MEPDATEVQSGPEISLDPMLASGTMTSGVEEETPEEPTAEAPEDGEPTEETPPAAPPKPSLRDLLKDPSYAQEMQALAAQREQEARTQAAAAERQRLVLEQAEQQRRTSAANRAAWGQYFQDWQARIDAMPDAFDAQDERKRLLAKFQEVKAGFDAQDAWDQQQAAQMQASQQMTQQAWTRFSGGLDNTYRRLSPDAQQAVGGRQYQGSQEQATEQVMWDYIDAEANARTQAALARQEAKHQAEINKLLNQHGLAQPSPDINGGSASSPAPAWDQIDKMSWEDRQAALKANPRFYEQALASANGRR